MQDNPYRTALVQLMRLLEEAKAKKLYSNIEMHEARDLALGFAISLTSLKLKVADKLTELQTTSILSR